MKIFTAHHSPGDPRDRTLFVKDGFSWPGFLFPLIWLVIKRLWLALAFYVLAVAAIYVAARASGLAGGAVVAMALALNLILGFEANNLYRGALARRGFTEEGPFVGEDVEEAELKYFQSQPATVPRPGFR